jgi:hypothetical protein
MPGPNFDTRVRIGSTISLTPAGDITIVDSSGRNVISIVTSRGGGSIYAGAADTQGRIGAYHLDARVAHLGSQRDGSGKLLAYNGGRPEVQLIAEPPRLRLGLGIPLPEAGTSPRIELGNSSHQLSAWLDGDEGTLTLRAPRGFLSSSRVVFQDSAGREQASVGGLGMTMPSESYNVLFEVAPGVSTAVGTVMCVGPRGGPLRPCDTDFDKRVVGVVSQPFGPVMSRGLSGRNTVTIAVAGVISCNVDARPMPIEVGDMLATSSTPGHARRAAGMGQSGGPLAATGTGRTVDAPNGRMLGKALASLASGRGVIPVLVSLS